VAIFGRNTARQRLRRAARESLKIPAFSSPVDCTPWVTGGLWPAELATVTADTAPLIKYLRDDLQRIVDTANQELKALRHVGMTDSLRRVQEARVINDARAYAVRRVESTVRHLHSVRFRLPVERLPADGGVEIETTRRFKLAPPRPEAVLSTDIASLANSHPDRLPPAPLEQPENREPPVTAPVSEPAAAKWAKPGSAEVVGSDDTELLAELATLLQEIAPLAGTPAESPPSVQYVELPAERAAAESVIDYTEITSGQTGSAPAKFERERLRQLVGFVACQEPRLAWAIGIQADGATLLVTDVAHGWVPPGITLPAGVRLLAPGRRAGTVEALLGETIAFEMYTPGDQLNSVTCHDTSAQARELAAIDDLGWALSEATHWRDGLPLMVNMVAKAAAAGTGILDSELDALRMHLDNSWNLLMERGAVDGATLLNCLLLAATEGLATNNLVDANYHFSWFQTLSAPWAGGWSASL
jgi:Family of unknown function (DUF5632)/Family of unknown function (DUF5631)